MNSRIFLSDELNTIFLYLQIRLVYKIENADDLFPNLSTLDLILNFELLKPKCTLNRLIEWVHMTKSLGPNYSKRGTLIKWKRTNG